MAEGEKDTRTIDSEPKTTLTRVKPERVAYIRDISIIERQHIPYVLDISKRAKEEKVSFEDALAGDLPSQRKLPRLESLLNGIISHYPERVRGVNGQSSPWNTRVDINHLIINYPNDRWKFYFSMDCRTPQQKDKIVLFFREFAERCTDKKVSLLTKVHNHDYDNPCVYTWQPVTMSRIISDLYEDPRFSGIWSDVLHPLQRPVPGISRDHIGLVQEPIWGLNGDSHSNRMMTLADAIIKQQQKYEGKLGFHAFVQACGIVGVDPTEPWRISHSSLLTNNRKFYENNGISTKTT